MAKALREAIESSIAEEIQTTEETASVETEYVEPSTESVDESSPESVHAEAAGEQEGNGQGEEASKVDKGDGDKAPETVNTPYSKPPASWKDQAKEVWNALPEKARREVTRREKQIQTTLNETAQIRQEYQQIAQVAQAYEGRLREWGTPAPEAFRQFMDADRQLTTGPMVNRAQFMANLIKQYGIDFGALDAALAGSAPPANLDMEARIQQLVDQRMAPITQRYQQEANESKQQVIQTIHSMEDNPAYPYFDEVRGEMADLIEFNFNKGVTVSLDSAYNTIVGWKGYSKPMANAENTRRALNASVSVGGSPSTSHNAGNPADLRGTIMKALDG